MCKLQYAIEELGHTQFELAELLSFRSWASELLSRRWALALPCSELVPTMATNRSPNRDRSADEQILNARTSPVVATAAEPNCRMGHHRTFRCLNSGRRNSRFACVGSRQDRELKRASRDALFGRQRVLWPFHFARREVAREALLEPHRFCRRSRPPDAPRFTLGLVRDGLVCCDGNSRGTNSAKNLQNAIKGPAKRRLTP